MTNLADTTPTGAVPPAEPAEPAEPTNILDRNTDGLDREASQAALKLTREEAAKHRVEARDAKARVVELEERYAVFEGQDENDRSTWVNLANDWRADPNVAATNFRTIANNVLGDPSATPDQIEAAETVLEQTPGSEPLTQDTVNALMDERLNARDEKTRSDQAVAAVHTKIAEAGFPQGTVDNFSILWIANNEPAAEGSVDKAIDIWKARDGKAVTSYQEGLRAEGQTPTIPTGAGVEASAAPPQINSLEDAHAATKAFLKGRQRQ